MLLGGWGGGGITKEHKKTFGVHGYIHYLGGEGKKIENLIKRSLHWSQPEVAFPITLGGGLPICLYEH